MPSIDPNCKLLLHCDGSDASTTFTDSSGTSKTVTANADAQIDTAQQRFGTGSCLFDGTGDFLSSVDHADWTLGTNAFTVDFWVRFNATGAYEQHFYSQVQTASTYDCDFRLDGASNITFFYRDNGTMLAHYSAAWTPSTATWYHLAVCRDGTSLKFFIDGVDQSWTANTAIGNNSLSDYAAAFHVGAYNGASSASFNGWIDEFNFVNGTALYTNTFSPPTVPYGTADPAKSYAYFM